MDIIKLLNNSRIILKSIVILAMILLLNLPMFKIDKLIIEREGRSNTVKKEFHQEWGSAQVITAPTIKIPYHYPNNNAIHHYYLTPENYNVNGEVFPELKHRGIFQMPLFKAQIEVSGKFNSQKLNELQQNKQVIINWSEARLYHRMTEYTHLNQRVNLKWGNQETNLKLLNDQDKLMLSSSVNLDTEIWEKDFTYTLDFNGSEELKFSPIANNIQINLQGKWSDVSYIGMTSEESSTNGQFAAKWTKTNQVGRDWFTSPLLEPSRDQFGAKLLMANDHYDKSHRATKYAFLLISLTYVAFFFIELISRRNIHPLQYALIGLALCLFYILLVSFSEQLDFNLAYITSTTMTIGLISWYTLHILGNKKQAFFMFVMQLIVYGFVFMVLQVQDYALIAGSVGLFFILGVLMFFSKKIDFSKETQSID